MGRLDSVVIVTVLVASCLQREADAAPRCHISGNSIPPSDCKFGTVRNSCNNLVCAQGPGQACSADYWQRDLCVAGTYCASCGRCIGCTTNLVCEFRCSSTHTNSVYG